MTCDSWKLTDHDHELTLDEFTRLASEIRQMNIPIVTIGGGEPTLRKDIWDIIRAMKEQNLNVQMTTNALALSERQIEQMYDSGLDRLTISYDSHIPELYDRIRGVDGLKKVDRAIENILNTRPQWFQVDTNTVLCKENATTFLETIDDLLDRNVDKINFSAVTTSSINYLMTESKNDLSEIPLDQIQRIAEGILNRKRNSKKINASPAFIQGLEKYYKNPSKIVYPCFSGYLTLDIFQDGSIHGCGNLPSVGNVRENSLEEIWGSSSAQENRVNMAKGKCPNCYLSCKMELAIAANPKHMVSFAFDKILS